MSQQNPISAFPYDIQIALLHFKMHDWRTAKNCRKHGVGAMRKNLGRDDPQPVVPIKPDEKLPDNVVSIMEGEKARRAKQRAKLIKAGIPIDTRGSSERPEFKAIHQWRAALAELCDDCGMCRWARRPA